MKYFVRVGLATVALIGSSGLAVSDTTIHRSTNMMSTPGVVSFVAMCATGFNKGSYAGASSGNYECKTPRIKCPEKAGMISFTEEQSTTNTTAGVQFSYRCTYQKIPS